MTNFDCTVLVVDSFRGEAEAYRHWLQPDAETTYQVLSACYDDSLAERCQADWVDVVLMESHLPNPDGLQAMVKLRSQLGEDCPPVIIIDQNEVDYATQACKLGAADYLVRDRITADRLRQTLAAVLFPPGLADQGIVRLPQSEVQFREIADQTPVVIWLTEPDGTCSFMSEGWQALTGQTPDAARGTGWLESVHPKDCDRTVAAFLAANACQEAFAIDYRLRSPDGVYRWVNCTGQPRFDAEGQFKGFSGIHLSIQDRRDMEETLQESEARYRTLFNLMDEGFCILQVIFDAAQQPIDYCFLETNPVFEQQTGLSNVLGKRMRDLVPNIESFWVDIYGAVALTGTPIRLEDHAQSMGRWFDINAFRIGAPQEHKVAVFFSDITDRKQWEAALQRANGDLWEQAQLLQEMNQALQSTLEELQMTEEELRTQNEELAATRKLVEAERNRYQDLFNLAPDGYVVTDAMNGQMQEANRAFAALVKFEQAQLIGVPLKTYIADADQRAFQNLRYELHERPQGEKLQTEELNLVSMEGQLIPIALIGTVIRDAQGAVTGFRWLIQDISDRKQAEAEREQLLEWERLARAEAEQANRSKDEFLAILSHELRTPLNPILGWSRLLQTRKCEPSTVQQALSTIERNAKHQTQLINDLLDIAKILRNKLEIDQEPVDLAAVIESTLEVVETPAEAKSIALQSTITDTCVVQGDERRLRQVLWNLLTNAIKFTPPGGQVEVKLAAVNGQAQITIADTGKGISAQFLPHLFQSFHQEDASATRKHGGLGLGLAIVKDLVEAHGGTITGDSPGAGKGATFTVQIPLLPAERSPKNAVQRESSTNRR